MTQNRSSNETSKRRAALINTSKKIVHVLAFVLTTIDFVSSLG